MCKDGASGFVVGIALQAFVIQAPLGGIRQRLLSSYDTGTSNLCEADLTTELSAKAFVTKQNASELPPRT